MMVEVEETYYKFIKYYKVATQSNIGFCSVPFDYVVKGKKYNIYDIGCGYGMASLMANKFVDTNKIYLIDPFETEKYIKGATKEKILSTYNKVILNEKLNSNYFVFNDVNELKKEDIGNNNIFYIDTMDVFADFIKVLKLGIKKGDMIIIKKGLSLSDEKQIFKGKDPKKFALIRLVQKNFYKVFSSDERYEEDIFLVLAKKDFQLKTDIKYIDVPNKAKVGNEIKNYLKKYDICFDYKEGAGKKYIYSEEGNSWVVENEALIIKKYGNSVYADIRKCCAEIFEDNANFLIKKGDTDILKI